MEKEQESSPLLRSKSPQVQSPESQSVFVEYPKDKTLCGLVGWRRVCCITCIVCTTCIFLICMGVLLAAYLIINRDEPIRITPIEESINVPDAPDAPTLLKQDIESVTIAWNEPDNHRSIIRAYEVQFAELSELFPPEELNFTTHLPGPGVALRYEVDGLSPGSEYAFRVRAINEIGPGNYSEPSGYGTLNATAPSNPSAPLVVEVDSSSLGVRWEPGPQNGASVTGSEVQMALKTNLADEPVWETVYEGGSMSTFIEDLEEFTFYLFRARTLSLQGPSNWSAIAEYHTDSWNATVPSPADLMTLDARTCSSLQVSWVRPKDGGSEILYYELLGVTVGGEYYINSTKILRNPESSKETAKLKDLIPSQIYQVLNFPVNSFGRSSESPLAVLKTLDPSAPDTPSAPLVISATPNSVTLEWTEPTLNCAEVDSYSLERDDWWSDQPFGEIFSGMNLTFEERDLLPAVTYNFRLIASSAYGRTAPSAVTSFTTFNNGACGNPGDVLIVKENFDTMQGTIQNCLIRCTIGGTECALDCIIKELGLSEPCADCWVRMGLCTLNACALECLRPSSEACFKCTEEKCFPDTIVCTGMPEWSFPR